MALHHGRILYRAVNIITRTQRRLRVQEVIMYKWLTGLIAVVVIADPDFSWLVMAGELKDVVIAAMFAVVAVPWVVSHFDN